MPVALVGTGGFFPEPASEIGSLPTEMSIAACWGLNATLTAHPRHHVLMTSCKRPYRVTPASTHDCFFDAKQGPAATRYWRWTMRYEQGVEKWA